MLEDCDIQKGDLIEIRGDIRNYIVTDVIRGMVYGTNMQLLTNPKFKKLWTILLNWKLKMSSFIQEVRKMQDAKVEMIGIILDFASEAWYESGLRIGPLGNSRPLKLAQFNVPFHCPQFQYYNFTHVTEDRCLLEGLETVGLEGISLETVANLYDHVIKHGFRII